jgi:hypothetical protein
MPGISWIHGFIQGLPPGRVKLPGTNQEAARMVHASSGVPDMSTIARMWTVPEGCGTSI